MIKKLIHIDDFFEDPQFLYGSIANLRFQPTEFGAEIEQFNLVTPNIGTTFSAILGEQVTVDEERSGIFRRPSGFIHFEGFDSPTDWIFAVALHETIFNVWHHKDKTTNRVDSMDALHSYKHDYRDLFSWENKSNITLKPNNCVFFRPWLFHSFIGGCTHMYFLRGETK